MSEAELRVWIRNLIKKEQLVPPELTDEQSRRIIRNVFSPDPSDKYKD